MKTSQNGIDLIKKVEGFSATKYKDAAGFSIGYGHFIKPGENLTRITEAKGEELLRQDIATAENAINRLVNAPISQNQFDACVSLTYNIGVGGFQKSSVLRNINSKNSTAAVKSFALWNKAQGVVNAALVKRRALEQQLFSSVAKHPGEAGGSVAGVVLVLLTIFF